jgi:hypothetical protein
VIGPSIDPQVGMELYEAKATPLTTLIPPGSYDTWLDLAMGWSWGWDLHPRSGYWETRGGDVLVQDKEGSFHLRSGASRIRSWSPSATSR